MQLSEKESCRYKQRLREAIISSPTSPQDFTFKVGLIISREALKVKNRNFFEKTKTKNTSYMEWLLYSWGALVKMFVSSQEQPWWSHDYYHVSEHLTQARSEFPPLTRNQDQLTPGSLLRAKVIASKGQETSFFTCMKKLDALDYSSKKIARKKQERGHTVPGINRFWLSFFLRAFNCQNEL